LFFDIAILVEKSNKVHDDNKKSTAPNVDPLKSNDMGRHNKDDNVGIVLNVTAHIFGKDLQHITSIGLNNGLKKDTVSVNSRISAN